MKKLAVVILNWNGAKYLQKFIPSVLASTYSNFELIVVDNNSSDNSVQLLNSNFPQVKIIQNKTNHGFAGGYNEGLKSVDNPYILLLNSDIEVEPDWLEPLMKFAEENPEAGAIQPKIRSFDKKDHFEYAGAAGGFIDYLGYPFCRGRIFDNCEKDSGQYDDVTEIFWASGAALLIENKKFKQAKGFDADLFAHMEEIDLCWRLQLLGFKNYVIPQSVVYHVGGGTLSKSNPKKDYLNFRNNLYIITKNHKEYQKVLTKRKYLDAAAAVMFLIQGKIGSFNAVIAAYKDFHKMKASALIKRKELHPRVLETIFNKSIVKASKIKRLTTYTSLKF